MYRILLNVCRDHWTRRKKLPLVSLTEDQGWDLGEIVDEDPDNSPEMALLAREARFMCLHCLTECLPPGQRQVFCLTVTLDLSHRAAAEILGLTEGAVKASLHRAMKRWKGYMENRCEFLRPDNPCRCRQWVRFGLRRGWLKAPPAAPPRDEVNPAFREEILRLKDLHSLYQKLYGDRADQALAGRIAEGLDAGEWILFKKSKNSP